MCRAAKNTHIVEHMIDDDALKRTVLYFTSNADANNCISLCCCTSERCNYNPHSFLYYYSAGST